MPDEPKPIGGLTGPVNNWRDALRRLFPVPPSCPHCGEKRQIEPTARGWFCNTCGKEF